MDYKKLRYSTRRARDAYVSAEEIETRQLAELHQLVEDWRDGLSLWEMMWQLEHVMDIWTGQVFDKTFRHADYLKDEEIEKARARLLPFIRPEFLEGSEPAGLREAIAGFVTQIEERDDLTSFDFAGSIVRTVMRPAEDFPQFSLFIEKYGQNWDFIDRREVVYPEPRPWFGVRFLTPHDHLISSLEQERERWQERASERHTVFGTLQPEPEARFIQRIKPYIEGMRADWEYEGNQRLIKSMNVDATGSGQIKSPFYNPNFLPDAPLEEDKLKEFNPYQQNWHKEDLYGTEIAIITTYSIGFEPCHPDQLLELSEKVRKALKLIGIIPPGFGIPTDYDAEPYKRPFYPSSDLQDVLDEHRLQVADEREEKDIEARANLTGADREALMQEFMKLVLKPKSKKKWWGSAPKSIYGDGHELYCDVTLHEGKVNVVTRLDLDDTFLLYYLLEHYMEPSVVTARALNAARFLEARSAPQQKGGLDTSYDTSFVAPDKQVGDLDLKAQQALTESLEAARALYYTKQIDERGFVEQVMSVAAHSLNGTMVDDYGLFPSYDHLLVSPTANGPLTLQEAFKSRTRAFLNIVAGLSPDADEPLSNALFQSATRMRDGIRKKWQRNVEQQDEEMTARIEEMCRVGGKSIDNWHRTIEEHEKSLHLSDVFSGYAARKRAHLAPGEVNLLSEDMDKPAQELHDAWVKKLEETASSNNPNVITREAAQAQLDHLRHEQDRQDDAKREMHEGQLRLPQARTGLVVRDPDVPPCADRVYAGTLYTSRLRGSVLPRRELPSALRPFIEPAADPYQPMSTLLIQYKDDFGLGR